MAGNIFQHQIFTGAVEVQAVLIGLCQQMGKRNVDIFHINILPVAHEQGVSALVHDGHVDHFKILYAEELERHHHYAAGIVLGQAFFL